MLLSDLLVTTKDGDWGAESSQPGFVPYRVIRGADFPDVRMGDNSPVPLRFLDSNTVARRTLQPNDIIIETAGGNHDRPTGRTLLLTEKTLRSFDLPVTCASFCRFLRVDPNKADPRFVFWYLQFLYEQGEMWQHQVQHTGVARFQYTRFAGSIDIPLPTPREQDAIAAMLGAVEDKIVLNRRMNETLEAMARAIFKSWFVNFDPVRAKSEGRQPFGMAPQTTALFPSSFADSTLGKIPGRWEVKLLSDLCSTQYGYTASATKEPVGPKFLRVMDINKQNWIDWAAVPHCTIDGESKNAYSLAVGDLVVARMADPGKCAIIEDEIDAVFASYLVRLKTKSLAESYYVYGLLKSELYTDYASGAKSGSVQANMNARVIVGVNVVVPSRTIMEAYLSVVLSLRQRLSANVRESDTLASIRDLLLPKLVSGEIRIRDAEKMVGGKV